VEHDRQPAGPARVVRAVLLSDTSPPLYYLLLNPWTRAFGTGDAALRLFSVWWAAASLPLLWLLTREVGGDIRGLVGACSSHFRLLCTTRPRADVPMVWLPALALALATLRLSRAGIRFGPAALWVVAGAAGLLTHYFFGFVWLACLGWLLLAEPRPRRGALAGLGGLTLLAVLPWYLELPASLSRWRVSGEWLAGQCLAHALGRFAALAGCSPGRAISAAGAGPGPPSACCSSSLWSCWPGRALSRAGGRAAAAALGLGGRGLRRPPIFDLLRDTTTSEIPRYAVSALPAACCWRRSV
jgi:hypothetical protein